MIGLERQVIHYDVSGPIAFLSLELSALPGCLKRVVVVLREKAKLKGDEERSGEERAEEETNIRLKQLDRNVSQQGSNQYLFLLRELQQ